MSTQHTIFQTNIQNDTHNPSNILAKQCPEAFQKHVRKITMKTTHQNLTKGKTGSPKVGAQGGSRRMKCGYLQCRVQQIVFSTVFLAFFYFFLNLIICMCLLTCRPLVHDKFGYSIFHKKSFPDPGSPWSPNGPGPPQTMVLNDFRSHF